MTATAAPTTLLNVSTSGSLVAGTEVAITSRQFSYTIDEPPALGGTDKGANPVEHLLAALGAMPCGAFEARLDGRSWRVVKSAYAGGRAVKLVAHEAGGAVTSAQTSTACRTGARC